MEWKLPSSLKYKTLLSRQLNCWSLRCSWSIACQRCSNYIFILHLTPGFNGLGKDNCKTRRDSFKFLDLVPLILEILRYVWLPATEYMIRWWWPLLLTHWGRVTHICLVNLTIIVSDIGLSPHRLQAIIWTNAGILLIGPLGTNFSEILIEIPTFSFKKIHLKVFAKWQPFYLGLNVLTH